MVHSLLTFTCLRFAKSQLVFGLLQQHIDTYMFHLGSVATYHLPSEFEHMSFEILSTWRGIIYVSEILSVLVAPWTNCKGMLYERQESGKWEWVWGWLTPGFNLGPDPLKNVLRALYYLFELQLPCPCQCMFLPLPFFLQTWQSLLPSASSSSWCRAQSSERSLFSSAQPLSLDQIKLHDYLIQHRFFLIETDFHFKIKLQVSFLLLAILQIVLSSIQFNLRVL